jgi:hypothetical protein
MTIISGWIHGVGGDRDSTVYVKNWTVPENAVDGGNRHWTDSSTNALIVQDKPNPPNAVQNS